jgi:hypothetical protein
MSLASKHSSVRPRRGRTAFVETVYDDGQKEEVVADEDEREQPVAKVNSVEIM